MKRIHASLLSVLLGLGAPALSLAWRVPGVLVEASVEAEASDLSLPSNMSGIITVRACPSCAAQTFYFGKDPLLILAGKTVDLQQMSAALRRAGTAPVAVYYRRSDSMVTRIVLLGVAQTETAQ